MQITQDKRDCDAVVDTGRNTICFHMSMQNQINLEGFFESA